MKDLLAQLYPGSQVTAASGAIELGGDLCILKHIERRIQNAGFICVQTMSKESIPGQTDNSGNVYVLAKHYTNRWPGAALLMETAAIMLKTESHMSIGHEPRERNIWADQLANLIYDGFDQAKRWDPIAELEDTLVLGDVLTYGRQLGLHLSRPQREEQRHRLRLTPGGLLRPFPGRPAPGGAPPGKRRKKA